MRWPRWRRRDEELEEEIQSHLQMAIRDCIERGEDAEQAAAAARREFGNVGLVKDATRGIWRGIWLGQLGRDVRYGARMLWKSRGFTAVAVLVMALGIGPNTAMFSVLYGNFWSATQESRMVVFWARPRDSSVKWRGDTDGVDRTRVHISLRDYLEWQRRSQSYEAFGAVVQRMVILNDDVAEPELIQIQYQTPGLFTMRGQQMILGRDFLPEEGINGNQRVVVLTNRLWQSRFGSDPNIIGKSLRLGRDTYTVVGVMAPGYGDRRQEPLFPVLVIGADESQLDDRILTVIGLLKPGISLQQAQSEMDAISAALAQEYPQSDAGWTVSVERARNNWLPKRTFTNLWLLMGAVTLVLLIACANIANLLLARGGARRKEMAVRAAIGASRWRLFRQLLAENSVLCLAGGALGIALSWGILKIFLSLLPPGSLPPQNQVSLSLPVLLFTVLTTLVSGRIFGCTPAWRTIRVDLTDGLKEGGGAGTGWAQHRLARMLVVVEFALTLTLLAAAGMAIYSLWRNLRLDPGVRTDHLLTFNLPLRYDRFASPEQILGFYQELTGKMEALPDVRRAAISNTPPLLKDWQARFTLPSHPSAEIAQSQYDCWGRVASPSFLETVGAGLIQGRNFTDQDRLSTEPVVMVNETFVRQYLAGVDPLRQELLLIQFNPLRKARIVGVFRDIHNASEFGRDNSPEICLPFSQIPFPVATLTVWTSKEPAQLRSSIAAVVRSMDHDLPMANVRTMEEIISDRLAFGRFEAAVYSGFAGLALLLAVVGIYGVMSLVVKQRSREMGLRIALGAGQWDVVRLILKQGMTIATAGLILGIGCAWAVARIMQNALYDQGSPALAMLAIVGALLIMAALVACLIPARRAARVQPMVVLRND